MQIAFHDAENILRIVIVIALKGCLLLKERPGNRKLQSGLKDVCWLLIGGVCDGTV